MSEFGVTAMIVVWVLSFLLGALFGLRRTSLILFAPIAAFVTVSAIAIAGHPTLSKLMAGLSFPQVGYLAGLAAVAGGWYLLRQALRVRGTLQLSGSLRTLRTAIAQELDAALEPPKEMPAKLARLAAQMQSA
jgi:hypothetical protein